MDESQSLTRGRGNEMSPMAPEPQFPDPEMTGAEYLICGFFLSVTPAAHPAFKSLSMALLSVSLLYGVPRGLCEPMGTSQRHTSCQPLWPGVEEERTRQCC